MQDPVGGPSHYPCSLRLAWDAQRNLNKTLPMTPPKVTLPRCMFR